MRIRSTNTWLFIGLLAIAQGRLMAQGSGRTEAPRLVLVELFTSQGCDMCPEAERLLGVLAAKDPRVVPVALHVDYFNDPWKDPFSDRLHSQRQAAYNALYNGPRHPEYGLYYTPMIMVDGVRSENGRDPAGIQAAVRSARARRPLVGLDAAVKLAEGGRSADVQVRLRATSPRAQGRELLVCAVLRDDGVVTRVGAGENANRTLTARFPARLTRFEYVTLARSGSETLSFPFRLEPSWKPDDLGVVVFAQDRKSGEVFQTAFVPWKPVRSAR